MTATDFEAFRERSAVGYAEQNISAGRWPETGALERSRSELDRLLPQAGATPGHHLYKIHDDRLGVDVGELWLAVTEHPGGRSGHIYDVVIDAAHRRKGHARAAFLALEDEARKLGIGDIGLHVFANNTGAQALYVSLGYEVTGLNMRKGLA